jgi:hypothetical protein
MAKTKETLKVVTLKKTCEMLKCSLPTFYKKYKSKLVEVPTGTRRVLYELEEVKKLAQKEFGNVPEYEIVE